MSCVLLCMAMVLLLPETPISGWWDARVEASIERAPDRREAWETMLKAIKPDQRAGAAYLMTDLPLFDLEKLDPNQLATNIDLAYQARAEVSWGPTLPEPVFLDAVLPHANVTEPRDLMRAEFHSRYAPLVQHAQTPGEAALKINQALFKDYKVTYNTRRIRTDQSSKETIAQGMATCTGLSIMLVEACRSVGIPARVAGIHSWPGRGGNHTWIEIWDQGEWHFVGAAEPDALGLDHAWFVTDASKAIKTLPKNSVYAVTYQKTGDHFPVVWNPQARINAENVTDRYTKGVVNSPSPRLMVEVTKGKQRVEAEVLILDWKTGLRKLIGKSLGSQSDINLHLFTNASPGDEYLIIARHEGQSSSRCAIVAAEDTIVRLDLDRDDSAAIRKKLAGLLADRFGTDAAKQAIAKQLLAAIPFDRELQSLIIKAYRESPTHEALRKEFDAKTVTTPERTSPYLWREVGTKPTAGWGLVIAMHGGGGAPKQVNDRQWEGMFTRYYHDHPEVGGYVYLALRAPNDDWNGFYDDAICPLIERLIKQFVLFGDVNPNQVVILGASHGGYGAFVIGPKIPDRFAAVHASAAAPTPGETLGENLRNTHFTWMVGEQDTAYGRAERCQEFAKLFDSWRKDEGGFAGGFEWKPGVGHSVPDRDKLAELLKLPARDPWPKHVIWVQSDDVLKNFYYVEAGKPADKTRVDVSVVGNTIKVKSENPGDLALWLDQELVDLTKPVTVERVGGKSVTVTANPNLEAYCTSLETRGDPFLAAPCRVEVPVAEIEHGFLAAGNATYIRNGEGEITWRYPQSSRDGWVLPSGNILLALTKSKDYPGGGVVEIDKTGKILFSHQGTQSEVNTAQTLADGNILLTEAGDHPRILEVDRSGKVLVEVAIKAQTKDHHLQTRMTRKLANGNYLVPQLLDKIVREYNLQGEVVWEVKTPDMPFTAIRLVNGNTLIGCTLGNLVIEVDPKGETVWKLTNDDLPGRPINDACGVQRLANGNTVVTSHHALGEEIRLFEVTPAKKIVWTYHNASMPGIHHFQILDTNGAPLDGPLMR